MAGERGGTSLKLGEPLQLHLVTDAGEELVLEAPLVYEARVGRYSVTWQRADGGSQAHPARITYQGEDVLTISGVDVAAKVRAWVVAGKDSLSLNWPGPHRSQPRVRDGIRGSDGYQLEPGSRQADQEVEVREGGGAADQVGVELNP